MRLSHSRKQRILVKLAATGRSLAPGIVAHGMPNKPKNWLQMTPEQKSAWLRRQKYANKMTSPSGPRRTSAAPASTKAPPFAAAAGKPKVNPYVARGLRKMVLKV